MPWRDAILLGINHHLLFHERAADPSSHRETLLSLFDDSRWDVIDLWIPEDEDIAADEIRACRESGKTIVYNIGSRKGKPSPHPASLDPDRRAYALDFYKRELDRALAAGAVKVVTNSGADVPENREAAIDALTEFYLEICRYVPSSVTILIEPTDRDVSKHKLIGPSVEAAALCRRLRALGITNFASMVDMGHVPLMGETIEQAFRDSEPYVGHVHLGNCILNDRAHPLFGDKHVPWGIPGGEYDVPDVTKALACALTCSRPGVRQLPTVTLEMRPYPQLSVSESVDIFLRKLGQAWESLPGDISSPVR